MMQLSKVFLAFFILTLLSCKSNDAIDTINVFEKVSKNDSLSYYFPSILNDTFERRNPNYKYFKQKWYSSALYSSREPPLSRSFMGHNIYRFLWLRSFHRPVVFTLHNKDNEVWLTTKMLDKQPMFYDDRFLAKKSMFSKEEKQEYVDNGYSINETTNDYLVYEKKADRRANIVYNKKILLSLKEWNEFEQLLLKANFWGLPYEINDGSTDGAQWVIEGHFKNRYHFVDYHSPHNEYAKAGQLLIKLSGLQEIIY